MTERTPGFEPNDDDSVPIHLQRESPGPDKQANWLPAPEGDFHPTMRMYQPGAAVLDSSWLLPSIKKT